MQVDGGTGQVAVSDLRASFGRMPDTGGTVASPFLVDTSGRRMCNATSAITLLNLTGGLSNPPGNNWYAIGPFTISPDPSFSGKSQYEFIVTATLSNNNQYGLDPEMDVDNGT